MVYVICYMLHESKSEEKPDCGKSRVKLIIFILENRENSYQFIFISLKLKSGASNTIIIAKVEALTLVGLD